MTPNKIAAQWKKCNSQRKLDDGDGDFCVRPCQRCDRAMKLRRRPQAKGRLTLGARIAK